MTVQQYKNAPHRSTNGAYHREQIASVVNNMMLGHLNNVTEVTLTASTTSTTLTDSRLSASSVLLFMPTTANAATAHSSIYVTNRIGGQATINHASNAAVDQDFTVLIMG